VEKARELLGWQARVAVEEGIARTVDWLRERLDGGVEAEGRANGASAPRDRVSAS
jgi:dTDP-D-glucose 4,6-dehydratase